MPEPHENGATARRWPLLLAAGVFLVQCIALYAPKVPSSGSDLPLDKLAHVFMFAVVTGVAVWAGIPWKWVVAVMLAQAIVSELIQGYLLAARGSDPWDFVADVLGIALGLMGARLVPEISASAERSSPATDTQSGNSGP